MTNPFRETPITKTINLPNGIRTITGVEREVEIVRLGGVQEDIIHTKKNLRDGNALELLLKSSIVRIGSVTDPKEISELFDKRMTVPDMTFVLIELRKYGIGRKYTFNAACPHCEKTSAHSIDLGTLKVDEQKEEYRGKLELSKLLTKEELGEDFEDLGVFDVKFRPLFVSDLKMFGIIKEDHKESKATHELYLPLISVNGVKLSIKQTLNLPWVVRNAIRAAMDETSGGVDTELVMTCPSCDDREFSAPMPVETRDFFYPKPKSGIPRPARPSRSSGGIPPFLDPDGTGNETR
jgi:hypothetical protein